MEGLIEECSSANCNYHCCDFNQGNYIVLLPNEFEYAKKSKQSLNHLTIIDKTPGNGFKAICKAKDTSVCDNGYKPVDCKIYPVFPSAKDKFMLKGKKCPLDINKIQQHIKNTKHHIKNLPFIQYIDLKKWFEHVELIDYEVIILDNN